MNIRCLISYDGSSYQGWQPGIETLIKKILEKILQHPIEVQAASRTDAGVHAMGQVINFFSSTKIPLPQLLYRINQLLPEDLRFLKIEYAKEDFHPSLDTLWKEYHYNVWTAPILLPLKRYNHYHHPKKLDLNLMKTLAKKLIGKHDFKAFCNRQNGALPTNTSRELISIEIIPKKHSLCFVVKGKSFLYKMVRNIVGTLLQVGNETLTQEQVLKGFYLKERTLTGLSAPAKGLVLMQLMYRDPFDENNQKT